MCYRHFLLLWLTGSFLPCYDRAGLLALACAQAKLIGLVIPSVNDQD